MVKIRYCKVCKGWGVRFLKAGIPNIVKKCTRCHGSGWVKCKSGDSELIISIPDDYQLESYGKACLV